MGVVISAWGLFRFGVFVLLALPLMRLLWGAWHQQLGANPLEFITRNTGDWALYSLCLCLAVTPLRQIFSWSHLIRLRRMLGLYSFFYACLHFLCFLWFDHFFDWQAMWRDVLKRPFIAMGMVAFCLMLPLALTSHARMIRLLGGAMWQRLHRLVYVVALVTLIHYFWMKSGKNDLSQVWLFVGVVTFLLAWRLWRARHLIFYRRS